ncbi:MAG: hypothetical protein IPI81_03585 [Flavobacteriales bacterium]|nr:hypothetical protein [Flavobacteriales bacterium]
MRVLISTALLYSSIASAQVDLPVFGQQHVINGYAKDIEGEVLSYFSVYPEHATTALLTRCTDGRKAIAWETAPVPASERESTQYFYFSWIAAHNSTTSGGDRSFDLFIGEEKALTFTTHHSTQPATWSVDGVDGVKLVFEFSKADRHGDAHGFAHLRVLRKYCTLGQPLTLKVVGHAQDSPDWFMTFRYTFEEKVEVEALPFLLNDEPAAQPLSIRVMHFGPSTPMEVRVNGESVKHFEVTNGLHVFEVPVAAALGTRKDARIDVHLNDRLMVDTLLQLKPIIPRDIHLIHHSHTDIGYSHLQSEVEVIQNNNIYKALDLIDHTKDYPEDSRFVWNVESLWAVENFLGIASEANKQRFIAAVKSGSIALSANYANILTGLCTPEEMHWIVEYADSLRAWYGLPINSAMQTDIPGMSWSMVDAYAAHGIRYLSQGPNYIPDMPDGGDRIGSTLREQGDKPYWWKGTTDKDSILVWTAGQGYGGWHGFTAGAIGERGTRKIAAYMNELAAKGYPYDMVQWRYNIVSDNGPVDSTISDFVREWNEKYSSPRLIVSNVNDMMAEFDRKHGKQIPTWSGDFTPYWEDGAYSTAKEEGNVRVLSARLSNLIDAAKILNKPIDPHLLYRAKRSIVMWHEHTWGAWCSISDPDAHFTTDQWRVKKAFADSAGWYVERIERIISPHDPKSRELLVVNTLPWDRLGLVEVKPPAGSNIEALESDDGYRVPVQHLSNGNIAFKVYWIKANGTRLYRPVPLKPGEEVNAWLPFSSHPECDVQDGKISFQNGVVDDQYGRTLLRSSLKWEFINGSDPDSSSRCSFSDFARVDSGLIVESWKVEARSNFGDSLTLVAMDHVNDLHFRFTLVKNPQRSKGAIHLKFELNLRNPLVRLGMGEDLITPEHNRMVGSNNDFFSAPRWIDVSDIVQGVTIVCPQGALWEVGEMVDERKTIPGRGTNPELYKAWKTEAHSSSTIYLYALNNYWHTNFKADQEGPITFDLYLKMHGPFKLEEARRFGLEMTRPLITWWK